MIDFLGDPLRHLSRGILGPWTHAVRDRWTRVAKRIPVPPGTKDAIMSVGLMGATGTLDFDGLTVDLDSRRGRETARTSWSTADSSWVIQARRPGSPKVMRGESSPVIARPPRSSWPARSLVC